jgi:GNAT superfamily N-acetyltransferase
VAGKHGVIIIRDKVKPGDLGMLLYLHGTIYAAERGYDLSFEGDIAASLGRFAAEKAGGGSNLWIAESGRRVVGTVGILRRADGEAQLRWILVHPDFRRRGLGGRLLSAAVDYSRRCGYRHVYLNHVEPDSPALPLYLALGFRETDRRDVRLWGKQFTSIAYRLDLA